MIISTSHHDQLKQLLGKTTEHLAEYKNSGLWVHKSIVEPLEQLNNCAEQNGISLQIASGFRSYERQLVIWNEKVTGKRPILNSKGQPLDVQQLSDTEKLWAILRWSALPGTSRHHWGTDIDVWDSASVPGDYALQLVPEEYDNDGPFSHLSQWLSSPVIEEYGFFRPYHLDKGGIAPEPWHLSFKATATDYERLLNFQVIENLVKQSSILLKTTIEENLEEIFAKYILC